MKTILSVLAAMATLLAAAGSAQAEVYGNVTVPPGVYFGAGNPNGNFNIDLANGLELALRAKNRAGPPLIDGSSGTYSVEKAYCNPLCAGGLKASWNYEFSIHATDRSQLSNYVFRLGVDHDAGAGTSFTYVNPMTWWADNALDGTVGAQNSQNVNFGDTPGGPFDVFMPGLYDFVLEAYSVNDTAMLNVLSSVDMTVQVVPEPASMALFGMGLLSLLALRRRKSRAA